MKKLIFTTLTLLLLSMSPRAAEMDTLRIYFDNGQTQVSDFQQGLIDIFLETHYAKGHVIVAGHSDDMGDNGLNLRNSRTRAQMVAEYLVNKGFEAEKLMVEAWGETKPMVPNSNAINRTRNRRVEIIGIPYYAQQLEITGLSPKPLTLRNGTPIKYKEMTTEDGLKKHVFMIVLRKNEIIEWDGLASSTRGNSCGGVIKEEVKCPTKESFVHRIPVASNFRCPVDQLVFTNGKVDAAAKADRDKYFVFEPQPADSAYYFMVSLNGLDECDSLIHGFGPDCYTLHDAHIVFEGLKVNYLQGKCSPMREKQSAKQQPDGSYLLRYTDETPGNLKLYCQVVKGKRKKMGFKNVALDKLAYNPMRNTYVVTPKDLKKLRKQ